MTHIQTTRPNCIALCTSEKGACPAEVRALAAVFEKSASELKLKQKLLKCKRTIQTREKNRLTCLNTKFQKRKGKLWTYTYANNTKAQIDYVFLNKKWNYSALNCEAYFSFKGVSSDYRIVTANIRLSLRRKATQTTTVHYDWSRLNNRDIRDKYTLTLRNKFNALQEISETPTPNEKYEDFVNAHLEVAAECIPTKQRAKPRVPWGTLTVRKKRANVKTASKCKMRNPTNINVLKLKNAQNELANIYLKEQTEYIQNQINKISDPVEDRQYRIA